MGATVSAMLSARPQKDRGWIKTRLADTQVQGRQLGHDRSLFDLHTTIPTHRTDL